MSEGHNDNDEHGEEQGSPGQPLERAERKSSSYYYDDSTNYETYCEDDDDESTPSDEG
jgi:hypothetical protein